MQAASREQLLYLYARYKQVKFGNCNTPKPSFFDFEGKQKWEAWKALGDSSPHQAMQEYIATVKKLDPSWNPQNSRYNDNENDVGIIMEKDFVDEEEEEEENVQPASGESVLPGSQDLFITLEPLPAQGGIPYPEAGEGTSGLPERVIDFKNQRHKQELKEDLGEIKEHSHLMPSRHKAEKVPTPHLLPPMKIRLDIPGTSKRGDQISTGDHAESTSTGDHAVPNVKRAPAWTEQKVLDLIAVWGEESVQAELRFKKRNPNIYAKISPGMTDRGYSRDTQQCRVKIKELRQAYQKTRAANGLSGSQPHTCRFYDELHAILGGGHHHYPTTVRGTCKGGLSQSGEDDFLEEKEEEEDSAQAASSESVLPGSQELFITLEPIPSGTMTPEKALLRSPLCSSNRTGVWLEEDKNIFDYCRENNIDHVTKAIQSKKVDVNMKDEEGRALLHWACDRGHKELVSVLLQHAADVNSQLVGLITSEMFFSSTKGAGELKAFALHKVVGLVASARDNWCLLRVGDTI
ncbi:Acyl-CoA-binding domain-containing protein 6 [Chelonia mydas]|uniref:Acyl-CoA-binding domain-containing protein 6 n=1 Tax=Chelonia mydas TaxID=8469 RepID=M7C245_CHEMY|nr:Acyl-CoA-binding domain-containing protein 6 [Chelonia mydas]